ncbi:hypothetical protein BKN49_05340 [Pseudomonas aeruginosa]|jgi:predicted Fe-S protein YdhL (DUF1289 family)|nr:hypothetical protein BKN49_05340 [Pseudomonas aeruginosa]
MSILAFRDQPEATPCRGICTQSVGDYVCTTCGRTIEEARDWNAMSKEERIATKAKAKSRLAQIRAGANAGDDTLWVHA